MPSVLGAQAVWTLAAEVADEWAQHPVSKLEFCHGLSCGSDCACALVRGRTGEFGFEDALLHHLVCVAVAADGYLDEDIVSVQVTWNRYLSNLIGLVELEEDQVSDLILADGFPRDTLGRLDRQASRGGFEMT